MRLKDVFVKKLREIGVERIGTKLKKIISSDDPIRMMALYVANGKANVCLSDGKLRSSFDLEGNFVELPPQVYVGNCDNVVITREDLTSEKFPYLVVDCRFYELHTEKERRKLEIQLKETLGVVREFMWDDKLVVTGKDFGVGVYYDTTEEFLRENDIKRVVLLDPNGDKLFGKMEADCYIIGGIVDKSGNKKGLTSRIKEELEKAGFKVDSRRIELRGSIIGVPDRINHVAEIVLRVVLDCEDVERAIREVQPRLVARWRLRYDLHEKTVRVCSGGKVFRVVSKDAYNYFSEWLNINKKDFYDICFEQRFFVVSDEVMRRIRKLRWDERRRCYVSPS